MKMKVTSVFAFTLLAISIMTFGMTGPAFAANSFITAESSSGSVGNGDPIIISGTIVDYEDAGHALTFTIISPDDNIVQIGQVMGGVSSDGTFELNLVGGGPLWKNAGEYTVNFFYGPTKGDAIVNYVGGNAAPAPEPEPEPTCGAGTELVNGVCQVIKTDEPESSGGGCLIATAAYGTELAPQVQFLREIRDNTVMSTASGASFMTGFNQLYYSFSPTIADWERENPMFQEAVRAFITPMISTLSIMTLAEDGSEVEVLGLGISVIALNLAMYIAAPALIGFKVHKSLKSRK